MVRPAWESESGPKLFVAIATRGAVDFEWALRLTELMRNAPPYVISANQAPAVDWARNVLVEQFLTSFPTCEYLLFLDTYVIPPPDAIPKLMSKNVPVISGLYRWRNVGFASAEHWPVIGGKFVTEKEGEREQLKVAPLLTWNPGDVVQVDAVGLGCCLIHRRVFEALTPPWFAYTMRYKYFKETDVYEREDWVGEDWYFFKKVKTAGFPVFLDTTVLCSHQVLADITGDGKIQALGGKIP